MGSEDEAAAEFRYPSSKKRYLVPGLLSLLIIVTAVLCVVFIALYATEAESNSDSSSSASSSTGSNVCQTEGCFDVAVQILGAMDEDVDPCEDFYNFTCGNWAASKGLDQFGYNVGLLQQYMIYTELAGIIETDFTGGNRILSELEDLYSSCLAGRQMSREDFLTFVLPEIRQFYQGLGGWDVVDIPGDGTEWTINSTQFIREKRLGSNAFYTFITGYYSDDASQYILAIDQAGLTMDKYKYMSPNSTSGLANVITTFLTELAQLETPTDTIISAAEDIVLFEYHLALISTTNNQIINITVQDLYPAWPNHDWLTVLRGVFQPSGVEIEPSSTLIIENSNYFSLLSDLVSNTSNEVLENYAKWQLTWELSNIFIPDNAITESLIYLQEVLLGKPSLREKQLCVKVVNDVLPIALGRLYAEHILPSGYKEAGEDLVTEVMEGLRQRMMEVNWLDSITRERAIEKLDAIESRVAYPARTFDDDYLEMLYGLYDFDDEDYVDNMIQFHNISIRMQNSRIYQPIDRTEWSAPSTLNAFYSPQSNQITILEGIMRMPFFSTEWPLSMQYGALGVVIGHEFTHGFDNNGRQFDKDGRRRMWWTQQSVDNFNERTQCYVDQYSSYQLYGLPVNGDLTLGENIADNGGISASYDAYKKVAGKGKILPGLTEYNDDQLFFIAFAQVWCAYLNENSYANSLTDEHSPNPFRVIGTLSNNRAFAEAFDCPANAPMNPPDKCELW